MTPLVYVFYHGDVSIEAWEWLLSVLLVGAMYVGLARRKNRLIQRSPEFKYYLSGFLAKVFGGVVFSLIYFYYYPGGDTTAYYYSALAMRNLAFSDTLEYIDQMLGDNSMRAWSAYTVNTAKPFQYVFFEDRTFAVLRLTSIIVIFSFKSYMVTTVLIAMLSYLGVWAGYRTFVGYFPQISGKLAIGFLFMPSAVFWGSSILKDTYTFSVVCLWVHAVDEMFFKRRNFISRSFMLALSVVVLVLIKPYIFMVLLPCTLVWISYFRVVRIRSVLVKFVLIPVAVLIAVGGSLFILQRIGGSLDKFALDSALDTISATQRDLSDDRQYSSNRFDLGEFDGTWTGLLAKVPIATNAALFRPYLWESRSVVMLLAGLENTMVLLLTLWCLVRAGPVFTLRVLTGIPLVLMSILFALIFAFVVGVTTPNFGALVRFKIPLVPFYMSCVFIVLYMAQVKRTIKQRNMGFVLSAFRMGTGGNLYPGAKSV
ncbi:MAG: hypothetical protein IPM12_15115 [Flavobacteriales bacterium]|nr:hypothetical protein [Flavobacteriales bacterium]